MNRIWLLLYSLLVNSSTSGHMFLFSFLLGFPPDIPEPIPPLGPPGNGIIFIAGTDICIPLNGNAILDCTVRSGSLPITYAWTRDPATTPFSTALAIPVNEAGSYTCVATNEFASDTEESIVRGMLLSNPPPILVACHLVHSHSISFTLHLILSPSFLSRFISFSLSLILMFI